MGSIPAVCWALLFFYSQSLNRSLKEVQNHCFSYLKNNNALQALGETSLIDTIWDLKKTKTHEQKHSDLFLRLICMNISAIRAQSLTPLLHHLPLSVFASVSSYIWLLFARSLQGVASSCISIAGMGLVAKVGLDSHGRDTLDL